MKNIGFYHSAFVKQTNKNNCGIACVCMILRYAGRKTLSQQLESDLNRFTEDLSLLDLKKKLASFGWNVRCVKMDIDALRGLKSACILHMVNEEGNYHFQTLFAIKKRNNEYYYLLGDPAYGIRVLDEAALCSLWVTGAGLYIEDLVMRQIGNGLIYWKKAFDWRLIPKAIWFCIPIIHLLIVTFGIALSAVLQQFFTGALYHRNSEISAAIILLLLIITVSRSLLLHFRQKLLIKLNKVVNVHLTNSLGEHISLIQDKFGMFDDYHLKNRTINIGKFQLSVNGMISIVLSDGLVILIFLSCLTCLKPVAALINIIYLLAVMALTLSRLPDYLFSTIYLSNLHYSAERILSNRLTLYESLPADRYQEIFSRFYHRYIQNAVVLANDFSRNAFQTELAGALNVVLVLAVIIFQSKNQNAGAVVAIAALSYLVTLFCQRVNGALLAVYEGVQSARSLKL